MDISFVNLNGSLVPYREASLHINDLGLRRGYGIFDSFRVVRPG
jgi:D-alanine transaminase/branched-chain amino acid aminotransferase